jgi:hypothetical protein
MTKAIKLLAEASCYFAISSASQAADCDFSYVVQDGDTLSGIAQAAYGLPNYDFVYLRNPFLAATFPNLPVGETIIIPCIPGDLEPDAEALALLMGPSETPEASNSAAADQTAPEPAEEEATVAAVVDTEEADEDIEADESSEPPAQTPAMSTTGQEIRLLTTSDMPLYSSPDSREGGMMTELLAQAFAKIGVGNYKVTTVNYRASHKDALLIQGPYDIGYPWARPVCEDLAALTEIAPDEAYLCENFEFSEPFYEYVNGFFVRSGEYTDTRTIFTDFAEARICRPFGGSTSDLGVKGIIADEFSGAKFIRPAKMTNCIALLMKGEVDAISGEVFELETGAAEMGVADRIQELPALSVLWTIHAIAPKAKPEATSLLRQIDEALISQKISGEWFRVVSRHLSFN